jgi:excisionase family DNA binding protein
MAVVGRMTEGQRREAYRESVRAVLVRYYHTSDSRANDAVNAWWQRLSATPDLLESGVFMHREPMNTAASLIGKPAIPIVPGIRATYQLLLRTARDRVLGLEPSLEVPLAPTIESASRLSNPGRAVEVSEVMDIRMASDYLGISPDTLYKYASEGFVPAFKLGNRWRFKRSRLDEWLDSNGYSPQRSGERKTLREPRAESDLRRKRRYP